MTLRFRRIGICTGIFLAAFALLLTLWSQAVPEFGTGSYRMDGWFDAQPFTLPLSFSSEGNSTAEATFTLTVGSLMPTYYQFIPDDCVESVTVNSVLVTEQGIPFCDYSKGSVLNLGPYLHTGDNSITVKIRNDGGPGGLSVRIAALDPVTLTFNLTALALLIAFALQLYPLIRTRKTDGLFVALLCAGILLRILYVTGTPYSLRGHDTDGHIQYIRYMADHAAIPPPHGGWQFYQPPLYYAAAGGWMAVAEFFGRSNEAILTDIQTGALIASILTLCFACACAPLLFPLKRQRMERLLFAAVVATFPGLILFAARINNDVLLQLWMTAAFYFLLRFWQNAKDGEWSAVAVCIGLGILTKGNALLLVPAAFLALLLRPRLPWKRKVSLTGSMLLILFLLCGWLYAFRLFQGEHEMLVGNIGNLNSGLLVQNTLQNLTVFNPQRIATIVYNNPWGDDAGRQFFWEYLFRSAFFGEFTFSLQLRLLSSAILISGLFTALFSALGMLVSFFGNIRKTMPLWLVAGACLFGHLFFRIRYPYSSSQDFRYSFLALLPLLAFALLATDRLHPRLKWLRPAASTPFVVLSALSAVFIVIISLFPLS